MRECSCFSGRERTFSNTIVCAMDRDEPISIDGFPRAILHMDADAFFAAVEEALDPSLRGKPVVTGQERGIIACANYEAKARGVKRGIPLFQAKKLCPGLVIVPSDYEAYGLYSRRMFNILREFTPDVEEYSIDEAFADITGLRRVHGASYEEIALRIQARIEKELGITVSIGLSLSKALAKLCSKFRKPRGFTAVCGRHIHLLLGKTPLEKVWGFGPNTSELLRKNGLKTALDYVRRPEAWAARLLHKPGRELWNELRGVPVWKVQAGGSGAPRYSVISSKTFTPASSDGAFVYGRLVRNAEAAFARIRRNRLRAGCLGVVLRRQDFSHDGVEARLSRATSSVMEAMPAIRKMFEDAYRPDTPYRSTLMLLGGLENEGAEQMDFFEDRPRIENLRRATDAVDEINRRFGRMAIGSGAMLDIARAPESDREEAPVRRGLLMGGEDACRRLGIPRWTMIV
ncbi:MAG: DNA polymerase IV [Lentisphaerae bacterium]|nr:DNA polymerase IV [Lentisphaerota bacterium]